jgi:HdeA/HdeB family
MRQATLLAAALMSAAAFSAHAQTATTLSSYADADGWIDVQKMTCEQLAGTYQEDADMLTTWYSGWYNGLAKKHMINVKRGKDLEHEVIVYCKANKDQKIIQAISVVFKDERAKLGIEMK